MSTTAVAERLPRVKAKIRACRQCPIMFTHPETRAFPTERFMRQMAYENALTVLGLAAVAVVILVLVVAGVVNVSVG